MIAIFAKKRKSKEGREFYTYLTTLTKKDGTTETVGVSFSGGVAIPKPEECPMNIDVEKSDMNMAVKTIEDDESGESFTRKTLWIKNWKKSATPYVDTSMDDYEV